MNASFNEGVELNVCLGDEQDSSLRQDGRLLMNKHFELLVDTLAAASVVPSEAKKVKVIDWAKADTVENERVHASTNSIISYQSFCARMNSGTACTSRAERGR